MNKYQQHFLDQTLALGLPINKRGYAEDELLFIDQLVCEYAANCLDITKEIYAGRLPILIRGNNILIARSDAEDWYNKYFSLLNDRFLSDGSEEKPRSSQRKFVR